MGNSSGASWNFPRNVAGKVIGWASDGESLVNHDIANVSVGIFGAVGDGVTDDAPAIQAAIDYIEANYSGGTVVHDPLNYKIGSQLRIKKGVTLQGSGSIFGGYGTSAGLPPNTGTTYVCNVALDPSILFQAETWGDYIHGGGVVGILLEGRNVGVTGIEARTINGTRFDIWGEQFTDRLLKINDENGNIAINARIEYSIYRAGGNAACLNSGNVLLHTTTVGYCGFIWGTVQDGVNLDVYVTDASSFAHVQGGLQDKDVNTGRNVVFRGAKYSTGQVITANADNGSGAPRFTCVGHGLYTDKAIAMGGWLVATDYNDSNLTVTVIDDDTFDIESLTYTAEAASADTKFSTLTHAARRNVFGFIGGYASNLIEFSDSPGASQPGNFATINGEGMSGIFFEEGPDGQSGVLDYKVIDWPTNEIYQTRRWPMRDTLDIPTGEATLGAGVTRSVRSTGLMPTLEFGAATAVATNYAVWCKAPPHWGNGTITAARIRYTSNTDGANTFSIDFRVSPLPLNAAASVGAIGTLHQFNIAAPGTNHIIQEHTVTLTEAYAKGDSILVYIASNGDTDTATVAFALYSIELEYVSEGPPDHAPGVIDQEWGASLDTAPAGGVL